MNTSELAKLKQTCWSWNREIFLPNSKVKNKLIEYVNYINCDFTHPETNHTSKTSVPPKTKFGWTYLNIESGFKRFAFGLSNLRLRISNGQTKRIIVNAYHISPSTPQLQLLRQYLNLTSYINLYYLKVYRILFTPISLHYGWKWQFFTPQLSIEKWPFFSPGHVIFSIFFQGSGVMRSHSGVMRSH